MSLRTPSNDRRCPRLLCRGTKESLLTVQTPRAVGSLPVCRSVKPVGEPDALIGHVRFDERGWETGRCRMAQAAAPILDSAIAAHSQCGAMSAVGGSGHAAPKGWSGYDPERSLGRTDRAMAAWYHSSIA